MGPNSTVSLLKPNVIRFPTKKINLFVSSVRYLIATPNHNHRALLSTCVCIRIPKDKKSTTHSRPDDKSVAGENFSLSILSPLFIYIRNDLAEIRDPQF